MTAESEQLATIEGSVLNYRYQIDRILNDKGGMGLIYLATDLNLRGTVVLKKSRFVDEQSRSAFEREARLLYGLRHNALPRVIDYFLTDDQSQFFVMEFIPGKDLSELLSLRIERGEGPFPMDQVLDWYEQLLDALHYLHTHEPPIIHRDIKPQNLKLMPNGQVILLDFGLAKGSVGGMTLGVSIQGYTPNYAPLEQMRGSGTDARSDIYSLAVTMHCLLTGQMPPDAVSRAIETLSAQPDPLRAVRDVNPHIPEPISDVIKSACSLNQNERPQTAAIMRDMMRRARASLLKGTTSQKSAHAHTGKAATTVAPEKVKAQKPASAPLPPRPQPAAVNVAPVTPIIGQETQVDAKPPAPVGVVVAEAVADGHQNGKAKAKEATPAVQAEAAKAPSPQNGNGAAQPQNQFVMAFAPVKTGKHPPVSIPLPKQPEKPASPEAVEIVTPAKNGNAAAHVAAKPPQPAPPAAKTPAEAVVPIPAEPTTEELLAPDEIAPPAAVKAEPKAVVETREKDAVRPNDMVIIEHFNGIPDTPKHQPQPQRPEVTPAPPKAEARMPEPERAYAPPAPQATPAAHRSFDSDSLRRARMAAENLDKPRPIILNQKKERPREEEDVKLLLTVEPERNASPLAAPPATTGLRSFTEVIGFGVRLEMHAIPGGEFMMGSPEKRGYADEFPQHKVAISPLYMGRYPVTQKQFRAVMRTNPSSYLEDTHPVETVTWDEAVEFCRRLTIATGRIYRLPTEAEWEYACRAGTHSIYHFGDDEDTLNQYGWNLTNSGNHTHPVGEKKPNGWGLCDMHGNVWEWCLDWYDQMYYLQSPKVNPNGPTKGTSRVLRGGSRYSLPNYCRSATRSNHQPDQRDPLVGFRVVCEAREILG